MTWWKRIEEFLVWSKPFYWWFMGWVCGVMTVVLWAWLTTAQGQPLTERDSVVCDNPAGSYDPFSDPRRAALTCDQIVVTQGFGIFKNSFE